MQSTVNEKIILLIRRIQLSPKWLNDMKVTNLMWVKKGEIDAENEQMMHRHQEPFVQKSKCELLYSVFEIAGP